MMKDGFVRVAAGTPMISVADSEANAQEIIRLMREANAMKVKVLVLPELCVTGYTAGDLFLQRTLRDGALAALQAIVKASKGLDVLTVVGVPLAFEGRLYSCAAVLHNGQVLGVVPKRNLPGYGEFSEPRYFAPGEAAVRNVSLFGKDVPFGGNLIFRCAEMPDLAVGVEVGEDLWVPLQPSISHALAGATVIVNASATAEIAGRAAYRRSLIKNQSARLVACYVAADAGNGESTTDLVFSGQNLIAENGVILATCKRYECELIIADIDVAFLSDERMRLNTFGTTSETHTVVPFHLKVETLTLDRFIDPAPFVPLQEAALMQRCEEILDIQVNALVKRMKHVGLQRALLGVSGGLDSTLALLVTARAFDQLGFERSGILGVTMPCFGTTDRTKSNAVKLVEGVGATLREIDISASVRRHFEDIGHDEADRNVTYENAQARERTQVLMDLANDVNGLVVGTGDLSELALGWATFNGDHMAMYGVNAGVPKTLIRHLVAFVASQTADGPLKDALLDVLGTPVSPELLPPEKGVISQVTEDIVGPYALHDFFLYHMIRRMAPPEKVKRLALIAFEGTYAPKDIEKWLGVFIKRFFQQQFKRSCLPDGPKVGSVSLSPRGDFKMPSDAVATLWQKTT